MENDLITGKITATCAAILSGLCSTTGSGTQDTQFGSDSTILIIKITSQEFPNHQLSGSKVCSGHKVIQATRFKSCPSKFNQADAVFCLGNLKNQ